MIPAAYGIFAATSAVGCEFYYRAHVGQPWGLHLWPGLVLALFINFGIWGVLQYESPLALAVTFSLWTATIRMAWTIISGETTEPVVWVAFAMVVAAGLLKAVWR